MLLARLGLIATLSLPFGLHGNTTDKEREVATAYASSDAVNNKVRIMSITPVHPELQAQLKNKKIGSVKFWEAVAWCETNHNWQDTGYFSGGLGMAQSVWVGYGGREFASRPFKATKEEQIIVANRVSFLGWQTKKTFMSLEDRENNRPYFRPPARTPRWGKDCVNWKTRKPHKERYTEAGMIEWKKSRGQS